MYLITCVGVIGVVLFLQESQTRGYSRLHDNFLLPLHDLRPTEIPLAGSLTVTVAEFPLAGSLTVTDTEFPLAGSLTVTVTEFPLTVT